MRRGLGGQALALLAGALLAGCQPRSPVAAADGVTTGKRPVVRDGSGLLFTFFDRTGQMRTVDRLAEIEPESRRAVLVTDPRLALPDDRVYVADLTIHDPREDDYPLWVEQKGTWLDRMMPRVSVAALGPRGESAEAEAEETASPVKASAPRRPSGRRRARPAAGAASRAAARPGDTEAPIARAATAEAMPKVVVFGTNWCPSCRLARDYLRQRGVRFLDIDVERQPEAGQKMVAIQQANGMRPGAVPLIIVNGRAFQGFSRFQIEVAINNLQQAGGS